MTEYWNDTGLPEHQHHIASHQVMVVDDDQGVRWALSHVVRGEGMTAVQATGGHEAIELVRTRNLDGILLDMRMPDMHGLEVIRRVRQLDGEVPIIVVTAYADVHEAVEAIRCGAVEYVTKPFRNPEISEILRKVVRRDSPRRPKQTEETAAGPAPGDLAALMGRSPQIRRLEAEIRRVAATRFSVLVCGETGAGKEVVVAAIRAHSQQAECPLVAVDCGAIPATLIESELFGHEKGSFTGADQRKTGRFEDAGDGTLFLDEVGNLPMSMQSKLLRALQERCFYRIGGSESIRNRARVLAATNSDLCADESKFRKDLYYRLAEYVIHIPALRERRDDIPYLARRFVRMTSAELGKNIRGVDEKVVEYLLDHDWPGNVRELRNLMRRAVLLADDVIEMAHVAPPASGIGESNGPPDRPAPSMTGEIAGLLDAGMSLHEILKQKTTTIENLVLAEAFRRTEGNKAATARMLHVDYKTAHVKLAQHGIANPRRRH